MTNWQTWMACGLMMSLSAAAEADIARWDNGELIPGTGGFTRGPGVDLSSPMGQWSSPERNLRFADFSGGLNLTEASFSRSWLDNSQFDHAILTKANFSKTNLTGASFVLSILTNASFAGAVVAGAEFLRIDLAGGGSGITLQQLYSTASYQEKDLRGIGLIGNDLTSGDFGGQNLIGANFAGSTLTSANFGGAVVAGANFTRFADGGYQVGSGITLPQLYSTASYQQKTLRGIGLSSYDLTGADFSGQDLTGAGLSGTTLTSANLTGAVITGAKFLWTTRGGFTNEQLYPTASYQQRDLNSIDLSQNNLTGWDFSGQNLAGADFSYSQLTSANFSFADLRGALMPPEPIQLARNTIRENGAISGLDLEAGETLVVRDDIGITVKDSIHVASGGTLELVLSNADWGSTMAVEAGITPDLGGTLRVGFADETDLGPLVGTTFDFFDWPAVLDTNNRFDAIEFPPGTHWDFSQLYVTGTATLTAIPEPSAVLLFACAAAAWILGRAFRRRRHARHVSSEEIRARKPVRRFGSTACWAIL